jgi:hypothetical protein
MLLLAMPIVNSTRITQGKIKWMTLASFIHLLSVHQNLFNYLAPWNSLQHSLALPPLRAARIYTISSCTFRAPLRSNLIPKQKTQNQRHPHIWWNNWNASVKNLDIPWL